ncbi:hypothetical protein D9M68_712270 [compost metagenome]
MKAIAATGATGQKGTGNFSAATSARLMPRRMPTWASRIISQTQTVAKVAMEAISRNTFSGIR